jgi:OOP family OmpA-OmpF porin
MTMLRRPFFLAALCCALLGTAGAQTPAPAPAPKFETKTTSLPAKGLFVGDQLSATARQKLTELIVEAIGLQIQVALVVPTGPWQLDGSGPDERQLTGARLDAVKRFLTERGVDPKHIYVESRIDDKLAEPRLDVQVGGRQAAD